MFLNVVDGVFNKEDLLKMFDFALDARAVKLYDGYRKISLTKVFRSASMLRILEAAASLVPIMMAFHYTRIMHMSQ
jgi:hypothetical protein